MLDNPSAPQSYVFLPVPSPPFVFHIFWIFFFFFFFGFLLYLSERLLTGKKSLGG